MEVKRFYNNELRRGTENHVSVTLDARETKNSGFQHDTQLTFKPLMLSNHNASSLTSMNAGRKSNGMKFNEFKTATNSSLLGHESSLDSLIPPVNTLLRPDFKKYQLRSL